MKHFVFTEPINCPPNHNNMSPNQFLSVRFSDHIPGFKDPSQVSCMCCMIGRVGVAVIFKRSARRYGTLLHTQSQTKKPRTTYSADSHNVRVRQEVNGNCAVPGKHLRKSHLREFICPSGRGWNTVTAIHKHILCQSYEGPVTMPARSEIWKPSFAQASGSRVRIPLKAWTSACIYCVRVVLCG
jgi:hypothetical protein